MSALRNGGPEPLQIFIAYGVKSDLFARRRFVLSEPFYFYVIGGQAKKGGSASLPQGILSLFSSTVVAALPQIRLVESGRTSAVW